MILICRKPKRRARKKEEEEEKKKVEIEIEKRGVMSVVSIHSLYHPRTRK